MTKIPNRSRIRRVEWHDKPLTELGLPARAIRLLRDEKWVTTVGQFLEKIECQEELIDLKGWGEKTHCETMDQLRKHNIHLPKWSRRTPDAPKGVASRIWDALERTFASGFARKPSRKPPRKPSIR